MDPFQVWRAAILTCGKTWHRNGPTWNHSFWNGGRRLRLEEASAARWPYNSFCHAAKGVVAQFHFMLLDGSSAAEIKAFQGPKLQCCTELAFCASPTLQSFRLDWAVITSQFSFGKSNCKNDRFLRKKCAKLRPRYDFPLRKPRKVKTEYRLIWFFPVVNLPKV